MDFNIEETFEVFMAVAILTVAIVMVISASPLNYLHHHINENPTLLIYHLGGQMLCGVRTALYNIFFCFVAIYVWKALGRFILAQIAQKDLFWGKICTISLYTLHITLNYNCK